MHLPDDIHTHNMFSNQNPFQVEDEHPILSPALTRSNNF